MCAIDIHNPSSTAEPHTDPDPHHISDTLYVPNHSPTCAFLKTKVCLLYLSFGSIMLLCFIG